MRAKDLFFCIGELDDSLIEEAAELRRKPRWLPLAALAACAALAISLPLLTRAGRTGSADTAASVEGWDSQTESSTVKEDMAADEAESEDAKDESTAGSEAEDDAVSAQILAATVNGLSLGLPRGQVQTMLGEPDDISNIGETLRPDGLWEVCWFYNTSGSAEVSYDLLLRFTKTDDDDAQWVLSEIWLGAPCAWTLDSGIGIGSTDEDVFAAYPYVLPQDENSCGMASGDLFLSFYLENNTVRNIYLGGLNAYHEPETVSFGENPDTFTPYQTLSGETVTVYSRTQTGWEKQLLTGPQAKQVVTALNITDPEAGDVAGQPERWLVFPTGGVAALYGETNAVSIYRAEDAAAVETALNRGEDPAASLTLLLSGLLPDVWEEVREAFALSPDW